MKIELKNREKSVYKKLCCTKSSTDIKEDIVVPDTMEDILRILSFRHQCRIRSKNLESDRVSVSGELDVTVLYIPESSEGIRKICAVVPFEVKLEAPGADSTSVSVIDTSVLSLDVKPVNPRKVAVSASVSVTQCCYKYLDFSWAEAPDRLIDKLFLKSDEVNMQEIILVGEKLISIEEELQLPENVQNGEFISACTKITVLSSEMIGSKLIVKGKADIQAMYIVSGIPETAALSIGFSQLFELPEEAGTPVVSAIAMVTGQYFEPLGDKLAADIRGAIQIVCTQPQQISCIDDAYACGMELDISTDKLRYLKNSSTNIVEKSLELSYNSDYGISRILYSHASHAVIHIDDELITVPVIADIMYEDAEGSLRSCRVRGTAEIPCKTEDGWELESVRIKNLSISARADDSAINITVNVEAEITAVIYGETDMITELSAEPAQICRSGASAYMCKAEGSLWSIAKKYGSDMSLIKEINALEDGESIDGRLLLIPVVR